jgi:hypothetical protein
MKIEAITPNPAKIAPRLNGKDLANGEIINLDPALGKRWIELGIGREPGEVNPPMNVTKPMIAPVVKDGDSRENLSATHNRTRVGTRGPGRPKKAPAAGSAKR